MQTVGAKNGGGGRGPLPLQLYHNSHVAQGEAQATTNGIFYSLFVYSSKQHQFVIKPSDDFFCPVTKNLLLHPHLTSCCGNHLSQEAATRIQREGGACPQCCESNLSTVLNKHFQRQVNSLCVFCHNKDRGCDWKGGLADLHHHIESCSIESPQ